MIAKMVTRRSDGLGSFKGLQDYLSKDIDPETGEVVKRGEIITSQNVMSEKTAAAEMKAVADLAKFKRSDPVRHYVVSWGKDEFPTKEQWKEAVEKTVEHMGMKDHQWIAAAHKDTNNFHVHIMVNKVHPENYRSHTPEWEKKELQNIRREIEREQGWKQTDKDKEKDTRPDAAKLKELHSNEESLLTYAKTEAAKDVKAAAGRDGATWQDVHQALNKHGLELVKGEKGGFTVKAIDGEVRVKASDAFRDTFAGKANREKLEKLGEYSAASRAVKAESPKQNYAERRELSDPVRDARSMERAEARARLKTDFQKYKVDVKNERASYYIGAKSDSKEAYKNATEGYKAERERIKAEQGIDPAMKKAMLSVAAAATVKLREEIREKQKEGAPKQLTYKDWVEAKAKEGDKAAIAQLRSWHYMEQRQQGQQKEQEEKDKSALKAKDDNEKHDPIAKKNLGERISWDVQKNGEVDYKLDGVKSFTDKGEKIQFDKQNQQEKEIEFALKLAKEKFGNSIRLNGTDEFKKEAVKVAVNMGSRLDFCDKELNQYADKLIKEKELERQQFRTNERTNQRDIGR
jgi:hypothetical protein